MMQGLERLTGPGNRRQFKPVVRQRPAGGHALLLIDLDPFQRLDDEFGHALRDLAPDGAELFGLGGEEFARANRPGSHEKLEALAERVRASVEMPRSRDELKATISVSSGCARPSKAPLELMRRVDRPPVRAEEQGGTGWFGRPVEPRASCPFRFAPEPGKVSILADDASEAGRSACRRPFDIPFGFFTA